MRTLKTKPNILFLVAALAVAVSGCGKSKNDAPVPPGVGGVNGQYNIPGGTAGGALGSACTSIQGPLAFQGSIYIDSANIYAGQGAPAMGGGYGGYPTNPYGQGQISMSGSGSDGYIVINAQMVSTNMANASGQLQLSQIVIQDILYKSQYTGVPYGQIPCAQIIGINVGHYNTTIYGGGYPGTGGGAVLIMVNGTMPYYVHF